MEYRLKRIIEIYENVLSEEGKRYLFDTAEMFERSENLKAMRKKDSDNTGKIIDLSIKRRAAE